jgi:hypothetical protein
MSRFVPYLTEEAIERNAAALLAEYEHARGVTLESPIPIEDIVEKHLKLGIEFDDTHRRFGVPRTSENEPDILGAIFGDGRIVIDESLDPEENPSKEGRYRFTLAHEGGGHWRLHQHLIVQDTTQASFLDEAGEPTFICRSSQAKKPEEWQADFYASCLLMPRKMIFTAWGELFPDRKQRVLQPRTPIEHPFVEIARIRASFGVSIFRKARTRPLNGSAVRWPNASSYRRSPCASGLKSSSCFCAPCRTSNFSRASEPPLSLRRL